MSTLRRVLVSLSLVLAAVLLPATAAAASAPTVFEVAHAFFGNPAGQPTSMHVAVERSGGTTTLDVEWFAITCTFDGDTRVCTYVAREAFGATPTTFEFSLQEAAATADVTYDERQWTCTTTPEPSESCTDPVPTGTGTTHLDLAWTAGQSRTTVFRDESGRVFVQQIAGARATGEAFGEVFTPERNDGSQLAIIRAVDPAS